MARNSLPSRPSSGNLVPAALLAALLGLQAAASAEITGEDVNHAVDLGIRFLRSAQQPDGSWPYASDYEPGLTALTALALLYAGVPRDDPALQAAVKYILRRPPTRTYSAGLVVMALAEIDAVRYRAEIQRHAAWLVRTQGRDGTWTYFEQPGFTSGGDHSNTQFAVLGLHAARRAGVAVKPQVWERILDHFRSTQNPDGGWGYNVQGGSTVSMTAAGAASLLLAGEKTSITSEVCGRYQEGKVLAGGIAFLSENWSTDTGHNAYYTTYALERVGILSGQKFIGRHDWYRSLAVQLVGRQNASGSWGGDPGGSPTGVLNTAFALLTLAKGKVPVLVNKLQWSGDWNNDRDDMKNLTEFISQRLERKVAWQVLPADASVEEWATAPLLYMNGHTLPGLAAPEIRKLEQFLEGGGVLFAEACCGKRAFDAGFRALIREAFPGRELEKLPAEHDVYHAFFNLTPKAAALEGVSLGCRTAILYSPADLSCAWERKDFSGQAFRVGMNVAFYAMGDLPLRDKLDAVAMRPAPADTPRAPGELMPRGALTLAQIRHSGDWDTDPLALQNLQAFLREGVNMTVTAARHTLPLTSADLPNFPILFLTGHNAFGFGREERQALREHLLRGGFLLAEACCGRKPFDVSFRHEMEEIFPEAPLAEIPASHPLLACGFPLESIRYTPAVLKEQPGLARPVLHGLTLEGRLRVVYSPFSLGCGIENHACPQCRGVERPDALRVAANAIIYALGF
ncbi:MAG: DUF4159 domain-containing protein [Planctomycetes bacterium]|nr:DUF4159 domain-containing protein [Planctomycetota bacterium]